ncbi:MAG: transporter substrate-binding domain-containing protein, partial [Desulfamplus sp.]|nr:transporter substrate-binding domain-containing protein [Desulfamplus sp.]
HYTERPPYYVTGTFDVYGLCADPAKEVFRQAKIPFKWEKTPAKRQLEILKTNRSRDCLLGWFKNPEREIFAKYSLPIYQDKPTIVLSMAANPKKFVCYRPIAELLSNRNVTLLVKSSYSYGQFIDNMITALNPQRVVTTSENIGMLKMIVLGHADYFFISEEEATELTVTSGLPKKDFNFIKFSDMPQGNRRYLMFSRNIEDEVIDKINSAIMRYGYDGSKERERSIE